MEIGGSGGWVMELGGDRGWMMEVRLWRLRVIEVGVMDVSGVIEVGGYSCCLFVVVFYFLIVEGKSLQIQYISI